MKWEYKYETFIIDSYDDNEVKELEMGLTLLGSQGWEICFVNTRNTIVDQIAFDFILKREK